MSEFGEDMITGIEEFLNDLKNGNEFEITEVRREETPDGPLHSRTKMKVRFTMERRTFLGAMLGTCAGAPFLGTAATVVEGPSPILTYLDILSAPSERLKLCTSALRLTNGEILQGPKLKYVTDIAIRTYRRTFVFEEILVEESFEIEKVLLLDWDGRVMTERFPPGGRTLAVEAGAKLQLGQVITMIHRDRCQYFLGKQKGDPCHCLDMLLLGQKGKVRKVR